MFTKDELVRIASICDGELKIVQFCKGRVPELDTHQHEILVMLLRKKAMELASAPEVADPVDKKS